MVYIMSKRIDVEKVNEIITMTKNNDSCREIAEKVGVGKRTVHRYQELFSLL